MVEIVQLEPWVDKRELARILDCSLSWVEKRMAQGMPHAIIAGRCKFRESQIRPWLESQGYFEQRGHVA